MSTPAPLWAGVGLTSNKSKSQTLEAPGEPMTPFMIASAGAAAPTSECCDPIEPAANVGAVDGALKPPSEDAIAREDCAREVLEQATRHQHYG